MFPSDETIVERSTKSDANGKKIDQGFVYQGVGVVTVIVEQSTKGIFECPGVSSIGVCFNGGHVYNVFSLKVIGDSDPIRKNSVERQGLELRLVLDPAHVFFFEVEENGNVVAFIDRFKL